MYIPKQLRKAAEQGDIGLIQQILSQHDAPLHQAFAKSYLRQLAFEGHLELIKYLHKQGVGMDVSDKTGATVLHYAALGGHLKLVKYLHKQGAAINASDKTGRTVLHAAALHGDLALVQYLHKHGVAVNATDINGRTALH